MIRTHAFPLTPLGVGLVIGAIIMFAAVPQFTGPALAQETASMDGATPAELAQVIAARNPVVRESLTTPWRKAKCTFYGARYAKGVWHTADGTRYTVDGGFVATRLVPIGTRLALRYKNRLIEVVVRDTPARRFGHRLDLPDKTWAKLTGEKPSRGIVTVEWRVVTK